MLNLQEDLDCDPVVVEAIVIASTNAMSKAADRDEASPSEVLSAIFTLLDRSLRGVRRFQDDTERFANAKEISRVLNDLLMDHGKVPH